MGDSSKIEWTDATWNCITGCTKVSPGCDHCYAETFAERWRGTPGHHFENGFDVQLRPERLEMPLRWRKPRRIFVNSMSDLFHDSVPDEFIAQAFGVMAATPRHTYQILTKRHGRMRSLLSSPRWASLVHAAFSGLPDSLPDGPLPVADYDRALRWAESPVLASDALEPLPNVWLGVSVENQQWADIRVPALLDTPAARRFLSCEPLLGPLDAERWLWDGDRDMPGGLHWLIVGGESGPGARPMDPDWARSLASQCRDAGVPAFVKQLGAVAGRELGAGRKGGDWDAWPSDLRIREFPAPVAAAA